jgi:hypothetical protein
MSDEIFLVFYDPVEPERFLDLVEEIGGERRPDEWTGAILSDEDRHVWVFVDNISVASIEPDDREEYESKLGAPVRAQVVLDISSTEGSDRLALKLIDSAAERWNLLVDNCWGTTYTVPELHDLAATAPPHLFIPSAAR